MDMDSVFTTVRIPGTITLLHIRSGWLADY